MVSRAGIAAIGHVRLGTSAESHMLETMARSRNEFLIDVMEMKGPRALDAVQSLVGNGGSMRVLSSPLHARPDFVADLGLVEARRAGRFDFLAYEDLARAEGTHGAWQHSKVFAERPAAGDGPGRAWFTNLAVYPGSDRVADVSVELTGRTAAAAIDVADAWHHASSVERFTATQRAYRAGLAYNDAALQAFDLTREFDRLLAAPGGRLLVWTKGIDDVRTAAQLVQAHRAGARVGVVTHGLGEETAHILRQGEVPTAVAVGFDKPARVNFVLGDDRGLLMTMYPTRSTLWPTASGRTAGRESGIVLADDGLSRVLAQMRELTGGTMGSGLLRRGEAAFDGDVPAGFVSLRDARAAASIHAALA